MTCGIYRIVNVKNLKCYVGSSCNIEQRWKRHKVSLRKGTHHAKHLQYAFNKYKESNFEFEVMITCDPEYLLFYEQQFLDQWKPEYNTYITAGSNKGMRWSEESKKKLSIARKGEKKSESHRLLIINNLRQYQEDHVIKTWPGLIGPDGTEYRDIRNLAKFIREHNLHNSHTYEIAMGKILSWHGWRLIDTEAYTKPCYNFTSPDGTNYYNISDLDTFAKEHNLNIISLHILARGERRSLKGWKLVENTWAVDVAFISPEGIIYENVHNISEFAREHNLVSASLFKVARGMRKSLHGWFLYNEEYKEWH
jgi:group I intron endonuclease